MSKLLFIIPAFLLIIPEKADAFVWSFGGEKLSEVEDVPLLDLDVYVIYKQAWILWIPIWNWDARYVLSSESGSEDETYYEFDNYNWIGASFIEDGIVSRHGQPAGAIPFWDKVGGKMAWVAIAVIFGFLKLAGGDKNNQNQTYSAPPSVAATPTTTAGYSPPPSVAATPTTTAGYGPPPSVANTPIPPALSNPDVIYISRGGQQHGPYSSEQARAMLSSGDLSGSDQAWYEGAQGWIPLNQVPGIA